MASRTFVFDSAAIDGSFDEVEATFYSSDDSDSNLSSTETSSSSSSSGASNYLGHELSRYLSAASIPHDNNGSSYNHGIQTPSTSSQLHGSNSSHISDSHTRHRRRSDASNEGGTQRFVRALSRAVVGSTFSRSRQTGESEETAHKHRRHRRRPSNYQNFIQRLTRRSRETNGHTSEEMEEEDDEDDAIVEVTAFSKDAEPPGIMISPQPNTNQGIMNRIYLPNNEKDEDILDDEADQEDPHIEFDDKIPIFDNSSNSSKHVEKDTSGSDETINFAEESPRFDDNEVHDPLGVEITPGDLPSGGQEAHADVSIPYANAGVDNEQHFGSTVAFPTFTPTNETTPESPVQQSNIANNTNNTNNVDVAIEEPISHIRRRRGRRHSNNSNHCDSDNNRKPKSKPSKRKHKSKSRRRYSASMASAAAARRKAGWEPGVDIRTTDIILQSVGSTVTIVDYNGSRYRVVQTEVYPEHHPDPEEDCADSNCNQPAAPNSGPFYQNGGIRNVRNGKYVLNKDFYYHLDHRPSWSSVRWISVNGLSWETISAISQKYQLHRLAIEDMVDIPQRTKVDMYPTHTFCVLPMHKLISYKPDDEQSKKKRSNEMSSSVNDQSSLKPTHSLASQVSGKNSIGKRRGSNSNRRSGTNSSDSDSDSSTSSGKRHYKPLSAILADQPNNTIYDWNNPYVANLEKPLYMEKKRPLAQYRRAVGVEQVSLFLTNQKTVISFFEHSAADIEKPLLARLSTKSTMLRESCDPSMLLQAIMDIIVDQLQPVITAYRRRLNELEVDTMVSPSMSHTQDLHLMAAELSLLRNNIVPITSLIQSLRDHTAPATKSVSPHTSMETSSFNVNHRASAPAQFIRQTKTFPLSDSERSGHSKSNTEHASKARKSKSSSNVPSFDSKAISSSPSSDDNLLLSADGRISAVAKIYLADVSDHLLSYTQDLDVMRSNTKNLIDMIFNTISIQSSDGVKQLSLVTVVFMPLSFWTGYFGMNFEHFTWLESGTALFWKISIPFTVIVLIIVMITSILGYYKRFMRSIKKRWKKHQRKMQKKMIKKAKKKELSAV